MQGYFVLSVGVAFVGATLGYMVGGSASPVVGVAVPAIFGLVLTALALMQWSPPNKDFLELVKTLGERADAFPEIVDYRNKVKSAPRRIGISLIVFSVAYLAAATFGAKVRIDGLLVAKAPTLPWSANEAKPPSLSSAVYWISLQTRLHELGYDESSVKALYALQVQEWKHRATMAQEPSATLSKPPKGSHLPSDDVSILESLRPTDPGNPGNPFAIQPPPILQEQHNLKLLQQNGQVPNQVPG